MFEPPILRLVLGLLFCTLLAIAAAFLLKRMIGARGDLGAARLQSWLQKREREIVVHEVQRLSLHAEICRLSCRTQEYLIVLSPSGVTVLSRETLPNLGATAVPRQ